MERFVKGSCYRKQHWTQEGNGGEERHPRERQQKEVHTPDVTLVRTGKGIKKARKKTKALATLHAALMHYMKKTVTEIRRLLDQRFQTSPAQPLWGSGPECTLLITGLSCLARMTSEDGSTSPAGGGSLWCLRYVFLPPGSAHTCAPSHIQHLQIPCLRLHCWASCIITRMLE